MGSSDGSWAGAVASQGRESSAAPQADAPVVIALVAATEAEHIAQTQAFGQIMMPRLAGGAVTGFTIRDQALPPVFAKAGVRAGDVVVSVNGRALTSNAMVSALSRDLAGARRADIVIERNEKREALGASLGG